ncbi:MAG: NUDIX domain-containing protein [Nitrososphaeraceae archaeon]
MLEEHSAGIVLYRSDDNSSNMILLLHYGNGHWDFPKGNIEVNETQIQAAVRELEEETGINRFRLVPGFKETLVYNYKKKSAQVAKTVTFYLGITTISKVVISSEHIGYVWLTYQESVKILTYDNAKKLLTQANMIFEDPAITKLNY